jgi:hypothetical protein
VCMNVLCSSRALALQTNTDTHIILTPPSPLSMQAAARARRLDETTEIVLLQNGPDVSFASCGMPYFIGGEITDRDQMAVQTPESLRRRFNIDVQVNTRVTNIDTENKTVTATDETQPDSQTTISYDELILAVGSGKYLLSLKTGSLEHEIADVMLLRLLPCRAFEASNSWYR